MTEPNNPLFEDEKEFLERKKLEYERALRGDVEEIKVQTIHAGKLALVGAGVAGGVWLLVKAFSGGKHKKKHKKSKHKNASSFEDYAGFDGYDDDSHDQELQDLDTTYYSPEYAYDHADRLADDDGFYQAGEDEGLLYQQESQPGDYAYATTGDDADDNGLSDYPDFPAHSSSQHGTDAETDTTYGSHAAGYQADEDQGTEEIPATSFASESSYQVRPYDDSRRLPDSNSFADDEEERDESFEPTKTAAKKKNIVPAIIAFAQTETGKVIVAQAAAIAMAFVTKKVKDILPSDADKIGKNADLAASSAPVGVPPATWPATTAAQDVSAAAKHDDKTPPREPLA
jgi:hypothetical protein